MPTALAVRTRGAGVDVPVAVSTAVAPLLHGRARGRVLARFPAALYVHVDGSGVLALVTSDGIRLPCALVVAARSTEVPFAEASEATAAVVDGALELDGVRYRPVRSWTPRERTRGRLQPAAVAELAALLADAPAPHAGEVARRLADGASRLAAGLRTGDGLAGAARALVGLGPGLTPAGDDVLAGALVTCAQLGHPLPALVAGVRDRAGATTTLAADLLAHAGAGRAAPPVLGLVDALVGTRPVGPALAALLALGSSSGHDTATGVLIAAGALLDRAAA
jgi:hypothetical protein